jgi:hypothetical protein
MFLIITSLVAGSWLEHIAVKLGAPARMNRPAGKFPVSSAPPDDS